MTYRFHTTTAAVCLLASLPALAQDDQTETSGTIVVSGARTPIAVDRIASATTVISRDEIERRQARYLTDLLRSVPGFSVSVSGAIGTQTQIRVRGGEANHVLVLVDGIRANDPATGDEFRWEHYSTGNIERIEIVRGPQSALWGSDAVGAVVNLVTRSEVDQPRAEGYAEGGSHGTRNVGFTAGTSLGDWSLSGAIESLDTDGTNVSRVGTEQDGAELKTGSIALVYDSGNRFSFGANLRTLEGVSEFDPVDFVGTGLPTDGNLESESGSTIGSLRASLTTERAALSLRGAWFDSDQSNFVDNVEDSSTASDRSTVGVQADIGLGVNTLSVAFEHEDTDFSQRGAVSFGDPNQDQDLQVSSTIIEYQHLDADRFTWIVSARHDSYSDFENAVTGKIAATFQLGEATRLRASVGTGQKSPTFVERFGFFPAQFIGNPNLSPESSVSYEVGVDQQRLNGRLMLSASLYRQVLEDEIDGFVLDPDTFQFTAENLADRSERKGVELTATWLISDALTFDSSYSYLDASENLGPGSRQRETRRPRHSGALSLAWSPDAKFDAIVRAEYGGTRYDVYFPPFPALSERVELRDYWLIDATFQYRLRSDFIVYARGSNLLDEDYEHVFGYATPGRSAYVGIRKEFGP